MKNNLSIETFEYIKSAADLRLRLKPWRKDQDYINSGGDIFYAVDTNIIKLFSNPFGMYKYAEVFPSDGVKTREILSWALGQLIFYKLTNKRPLFVIPPYHNEIDSVFTGIARDALKETRQSDELWPGIEDCIQDYNQTKNLDALVAYLEKNTNDLIRYVYGRGEGYSAELSRITKLLTDERILHIERYLEPSNGKQWAFPVPRIDNGSDYSAIKMLFKNWLDRLTKTKSHDIPQELVFDDAEALANLEWINNKFKEKEHRRLVLISADEALHEAASRYIISNTRETFADRYIRHPKVFLAAFDFSSNVHSALTNASDDYDITGWLDVFLARFSPGLPGYGDRLRDLFVLDQNSRDRLSQEFMKKIPGGISKLTQSWQRFVRLTSVEYSLRSNTEPTDQLRKLAKELVENDGLEKVRTKVDSMASQTLHNFWSLAAVAGYWSTDALERKPGGILDTHKAEERSSNIFDINTTVPIRGVPALRFTLEPVRTLVNELCCTLNHEKILKKNFSFENLAKEDSSGYTAFILYALAFGAAGRWAVTRTLSEFALNIADRNPTSIHKDHEPITGNEAAYLIAWATRHIAKSADNLEIALKYLKNAKKRQPRTASRNPYDIRYECETFIIYTTYHLFHIFAGDNLPESVPTLVECQKKILEMLQYVYGDTKEEKYIVFVVKKQLLVHLYVVLLIRKHKLKEHPDDTEMNEILKWLPAFEELLEYKGLRALTCFTQPVFLVISSIYGKEEIKRQCAQSAKVLLGEDKVKRRYVMPYDSSLYGFLLDVVTEFYP